MLFPHRALFSAFSFTRLIVILIVILFGILIIVSFVLPFVPINSIALLTILIHLIKSSHIDPYASILYSSLILFTSHVPLVYSLI